MKRTILTPRKTHARKTLGRRLGACVLTLLLSLSLWAPAAAGDAELTVVTQNLTVPAPASEMTLTGSAERWSSPVTSCLYDNGDGTLTALRADCGPEGDTVCVDTLSADLTLLGSRQIPYELPLFGGFYHGTSGNYMMFGRENPDLYQDLVHCYDRDKNYLGLLNPEAYIQQLTEERLAQGLSAIREIHLFREPTLERLEKETGHLSIDTTRDGVLVLFFIPLKESAENSQDLVEVLRMVQYDQDFHQVAAAPVTHVYTAYPFDASSLRMAERDGVLMVHTGRKRYDGHQSQLTLWFSTEELALNRTGMYWLNGMTGEPAEDWEKTDRTPLQEYQINHVSHSYNQFIRFDGEDLVLLDHSDGSPARGVVLTILRQGPKYGSVGLNSTWYPLLTVDGNSGANQTGISLGGFELTETGYLTALNAVDPDRVERYSSYRIIEKDGTVMSEREQERDAVLLVTSKEDPENTVQIRLTDNAGTGRAAGIPYLVKLGEDRFLVLWETYDCTASGPAQKTPCLGMTCQVVDGTGKAVAEAKTFPRVRLSKDCQPAVMGEDLIWFIDGLGLYGEGTSMERTFYRLPLSAVPGAEKTAGGYAVQAGPADKTEAGWSLTAALEGPARPGRLTAALYDGDGKQLAAKTFPAADRVPVTLPGLSGGTEIRLFWTDGGNRPLCGSRTVPLNGA